jgi:hypothetical protein
MRLIETSASILKPISQIYDVALASGNWGNLLEKLAQNVSSVGCNIIPADQQVN